MLTNHQVLVDGPSKDAPVPRHSARLADVSLTSIVIPKVPRGSGRGYIARVWEQNNVEKTWAETSWAKKSAALQKRRQLNDFERFKILKLRKQVGAPLSDLGL